MRDAGHLDIGPLRFLLRLGSAGTVRYSAPAYAGFFLPPGDLASPEAEFGSPAAQGGRDRPLCELPVEIVRRAAPIPSREPLWSGGKNWAVWEDGADLICCAGFHAREHARFECRVARDLSRAELALDPGLEGAGPETYESPLRYPVDQILSWGMLSRIGGALLHAAVAVRDGVGWVFAGRSGAGKSTLSALCHAEGFRILNDDRVLVFRRHDEWKVAGTPWHGSGRFAEAAEVPLGGIFFLRRAAEDRLESISAAQARLALMDVAAVPWFEDAWSQGILDGLDHLAQGVESCRFHFTKTSAAVRVLETTGVPA